MVIASEMVLVLDSIKVRPCLAASSVISSCKCTIKPLKHLRDSCRRTFNRTKSSLREVSNFFQPDTPMERRVMKTSIAGLADALRKKIYQWNLVLSDKTESSPSWVRRSHSLNSSLVRTSNYCPSHRYHQVLITTLKKKCSNSICLQILFSTCTKRSSLPTLIASLMRWQHLELWRP